MQFITTNSNQINFNSRDRYYQVRDGDTWQSIALRHNQDENKIHKENPQATLIPGEIIVFTLRPH